MKTKKLYPFSLTKHAHDIEYRYNRLKNTRDDYFAGMIQMTIKQFDKLEADFQAVKNAYHTILNTFSNGFTVWVDGETIATLKKCVAWAEAERSNRNR